MYLIEGARGRSPTVQFKEWLILNTGGTIGSLKWVIVDDTDSVIATHEKDFLFEDVSVRILRGDARKGYQKLISLGDHFKFGLVEFPTQNKTTGFSMVAGRDDIQTFCWEWFVLHGQERATKLQEKGEIALCSAQLATGTEILRTEFLCDVSFRVIVFGQDVRSPKWRLNIKEGSAINWPSLVNGELVPVVAPANRVA